MKNRTRKKTWNLTGRLPLSFSSRKERETFRIAVEQADEQCEKLGLLDPTETEPALIYTPPGGKK